MKNLGIIKGKWKHNKTTKIIYSSTTSKVGNIVCEAPSYFEESMKQWDAHAKLIVDAGNTTQACGLLPSELLKQRDELKRMVNSLSLSIAAHPDYVNGEEGDEWHDLVSLADELIKSTEQ
jgi:hypothetical protein